ncbi:MAG TPA: hypothetical protein VKE96_21835 [Vicinamibacterales bacterium]|nr:hypothetical protein [Vicinamibacterales bacterium]
MKKTALACVLSVILASPLAAEDHSLVRFDGGIGVIPVSNVTVTNGVTTVSRNVVRGINSPGQIWVIDRLKADVDTDGHIRVKGRGLLLGGGNNIGLNGNQSVLATLICDAAGTQLFTTTTPVPLAANGDFDIDDTLTPVPASCASPVLLIRNGTGAVWFAAGILKLNDD